MITILFNGCVYVMVLCAVQYWQSCHLSSERGLEYPPEMYTVGGLTIPRVHLAGVLMKTMEPLL